MKFLSCLVAILMLSASPLAYSASFDLDGYQDKHGAITVHYQGDFVDPYFAIKSLLVAHNAGLDMQQAAYTWIRWLMPKQRSNGLFDRFCLVDGIEWRPCENADSDDALLAMWLELLYVMAPSDGLPRAWQSSMDKAQLQLERLHDKRTGIYRISVSNPVGLFMDNVEIYAALRAISREQKRLGAHSASRVTYKQAVTLRHRMTQVFRPQANAPFLVSTQTIQDWQFYPHEVAQIYPWLHHMPTNSMNVRADFNAWLQKYGKGWLSFEKDVYPWGLVALTALELGDHHTARCWLNRAETLRNGERWNVLEEAVFQTISHSVKFNDVPCEALQQS